MSARRWRQMPPERRREYDRYMSSAQWRNLREDVIRMRGSHCERCGLRTVPKFLEVHHRTYERFGAERPSDLEVLCSPCHRKADEERRAAKAREIKRKAARTRRRNAIYTYARKKYGDMGRWPAWWNLEDEFDRWLRRKSR